MVTTLDETLAASSNTRMLYCNLEENPSRIQIQKRLGSQRKKQNSLWCDAGIAEETDPPRNAIERPICSMLFATITCVIFVINPFTEDVGMSINHSSDNALIDVIDIFGGALNREHNGSGLSHT